MEFKEFKERFLDESKKFELDISEEQLKQYYFYMKYLLEWNTKINVTAITNEDMFIVKHFIDSISINKYIKPKDKILDIGTGGGFPGIPLKILNNKNEFVLNDCINKKLNVVKECSEKIGIKDIEFIHSRAEDLANNKKYREKFDIVTTRAVSNLSTILEYMLPFVKVGGIAICMKGPNYQDELKNAKNAIKILGGEFDCIDSINVGDLELERNNIIIKKIKRTPQNFPRNQGKPLKQPIE